MLSFCPCSKNLPQDKVKCFRLTALAEEISRQLSIDYLMDILVALIQYFLIMLPFFPSEMAFYSLCHGMLKVCDLFLDFDFTRGCS